MSELLALTRWPSNYYPTTQRLRIVRIIGTKKDPGYEGGVAIHGIWPEPWAHGMTTRFYASVLWIQHPRGQALPMPTARAALALSTQHGRKAPRS